MLVAVGVEDAALGVDLVTAAATAAALDLESDFLAIATVKDVVRCLVVEYF